MSNTYRQSLEKLVITINGEDYVPKDRVEDIFNEIEDDLHLIPMLLERLY